ncbi:hypothetical protein TWF730_006974 [Orbilia blumenaviensis]|uniref:Uncharacterized protein n=1 Tax=Orbilia blumenaviensis TaxID=1796055 RepID=A0AAV9VIA2_9PEZI
MLQFSSGQITVIETVTVHSNSTVTITRSPAPGSTCCGALPRCEDVRAIFSGIPFPSVTSNTSLPPITSSASMTETEVSTSTTLGDVIPTGTPQGFLVAATIAGGLRNYYFSYTDASGNIGLVPQTWQNATYWFLHNGYLRDRNPPYRFVWLNPELDSSQKRKRDDVDDVVIYDLSRSHDYDDATENPLDSLKQVSDGYFVKNSVNTTLSLRSNGVSYSFAAMRKVVNGVHDVIAVRTEDIERLPDGYVAINLEAKLEPLPIDSTRTGTGATSATGASSGTKTSTKTTKTSTISSISGFAATSVDGGVMYVQTEPISLGTPAPIFLKPIGPFGGIVDINSLDNLKPANEAKLFYGATSSTGDLVLANLNVTFPYNAVYLDNSAYIVSTVCSGNTTMTITWTSSGRDAWQVAKDSWSTPLLLISASSSCPHKGNDTEAYLIADLTQFSDTGGLTAVATGTFTSLNDTVKEFSVNIGPGFTDVGPDYVPDIGTPNSGDSGLKYAALGADFNQRLNAELGFYDVSTPEGLANLESTLYPSSVTRRGRLVDRGLFSFLADTAAAIALAALKALLKAIGDINGTMSWSKFFTPDGVGRDSLDQKYSTSCTSYVRKLGPWGCQVRLWMFLPDSVTTAYAQMSDQISKWGNQLVGQTTYATPGVEIYCVDCYVDAKFVVSATVRCDTTGFVEAWGALSGSLALQLQFGINGYWEKVYNGSNPLATIGLGPFGIGSYVQIGPYAKVDFQNDVKLAFVGQLLLGMSVNWPSLNGRADLINSGKTYNYLNGLSNPAITKIAQVYGSVTITWTVGLPLSVALGFKVNIGPFNLEKSVGFAFTPQVVVKVTFAESASTRREIDMDTMDTSLMPRFAITDLVERQDMNEQFCRGALVSIYAQILVEFVFADIATLPLYYWPSQSNPFYLFTPTCFGVMTNVSMCQRSAVSSLKADPTASAFCSGIFGWTTTPSAVSTITNTAVTVSTQNVTSTTTKFVSVNGNVTSTVPSYTLYITGYATSHVAGVCTGAASVVSVASRGLASVQPMQRNPIIPPPEVMSEILREKKVWEEEEGGFIDGGFPVPARMALEERDSAAPASLELDEEGALTTPAPFELEDRALTTPAYFSGWSVASISSACGCMVLNPPGTKVSYTTTMAGTTTSINYSTQWVTITSTTTTGNITVATTTRKRATGTYPTVATKPTQSFPDAQYSSGAYTATADGNPTYLTPFKNYNLEIDGSDLASCSCGSGAICRWTDPVYNDVSYTINSTCSGINDCNKMCADINYLYGVSNLCTGSVFFVSRGMCVFKEKVAGLNNYTGVDGCGYDKTVASNKVISGLLDFTTSNHLEWRYDYNYTDGALDYQGNPLTINRYTETSDFTRMYYFKDGTNFTITWNGTVIN